MPTRLPSFWIKVALTLGLAAAADLLFVGAPGVGLNLGLFSLALAAALGFANPAIRRHRTAVVALAAAVLLAALQIERASLLTCVLFVLAMAVAALAPRAPAGEDGWRWAQRLVAGGLKALLGPALDLRSLLKARARRRPVKVAAVIAGAALPLVGGAVFVGLFAAANPVIEAQLGAIYLGEPDPPRLIFWVLVGVTAWAVLRPRGLRRTFRIPGLDGDLGVPGATTASVAVSLAVFNLIFAVQNALDIAFLWGGAGLPPGVTFADYAHRGAYPLIATAILAGAFVLVFLRPGSATAGSPVVRNLVGLWIAQNLFLVASTALRTLDYIDAYSLTRTRIAALLWMALVALGLVLIFWRLLRARSGGWLVNANLLAAGLVLAVCSVVDLGSIAAAWNVRHAREVGGRGVNLDLCYMRSLGGAAAVPLTRIEHGAYDPAFLERVAFTRRVLMAEMAERQADWRSWRWRDARRIDWAELNIYEKPAMPDARGRDCHGYLRPPAA
uniref:DUF4153 domain-containing protein n=1 Tax=unclassified Phenylobacterium TaxID=2640670 RepID=UPI00083A5EE7